MLNFYLITTPILANNWKKKRARICLPPTTAVANFYNPARGGEKMYSIQTCKRYISLDIPASQLKLPLLPKVRRELSYTEGG